MPFDFARNHDTPPLLAVGMVDQQIQRRRNPHAAMRRLIAAFWAAMAMLVAGAIGGWLGITVSRLLPTTGYLGIGP